MKFLAHLAALLFGLAAALTLWGVLTTAQLFNAASAETAASGSGLYAAVAAQTPQLLLHVTPLTATEESVLGTYVDANLIETWAKQLLPQLEDYYRHGGARPHLSLSAITDRAQASGLPLPEALTDQLDQPITISAGRLDRQLSEVVRWSALMRTLGPIIMVVLLVIGLLLTRRRILLWLAGSLVWGAAFTAGAWLVLQITPHLVASAVANSTAGELSDAIATWLKLLLGMPAHNLLRGAGAFVIGAVVLALGHGLTRMVPRRRDRRA